MKQAFAVLFYQSSSWKAAPNIDHQQKLTSTSPTLFLLFIATKLAKHPPNSYEWTFICASMLKPTINIADQGLVLYHSKALFYDEG